MDPATKSFAVLLTFVVLQRLAELRLAKRNERWARARGAREHGAGHYPLFFLLHGGWLLGWAAESLWRGVHLAPAWELWLSLFCLAGGLRYWAIVTLGRRWNTRVLVLEGVSPVTKGPYRILAHPNYVAVAVELLSLPLMFGAWFTALASSILNAALLLGIRIPVEERALAAAAPRQDVPPSGDSVRSRSIG